MNLEEIIQQFFADLQKTGWLEYIAVLAGIISVWFSKKENIWVYPSGLINTLFYIYLSFIGGLLGEASVNFYYTIMSIYGWIGWAKKDDNKNIVLQISAGNKKEWKEQFIFFSVFYLFTFSALSYLKNNFAPEAIPWADAFASASAFTAMWLMTKKKIESWYWWIVTNIVSIPLYFVKHYVFTSVYYFILLIMAIFGLMEWINRYEKLNKVKS